MTDEDMHCSAHPEVFLGSPRAGVSCRRCMDVNVGYFRAFDEIEPAIDALFRARWEFDDGEFDITNLDDELDALAEAMKFDRAEAVVRWEKQREQEIVAARAEYAAQPSDPQVAVRNIGHAIADVLRSLSGESLIGEDVHALWKDTKK